MKNGYICVLFFLTAISTASALNVDSSECPQSYNPFMTSTQCASYGFRETCQRTDNPGVLTSAGTLTTITGESFACDTCAYCGAENPPPVVCTGAVAVSYTETHNYAVNPGIKASGEVIEVSLGGTIGWGSQTQYSFTLTCGTQQWPACKQAYDAFGITMQAWEGRAAKVTSTYTWRIESLMPCFQPYSDPGGSRDSTASGSKAKEGSATCKALLAPQDCE